MKQRSARLQQSPIRKNPPITPGKKNSLSPRKCMQSPPGRGDTPWAQGAAW